MERQGRALFAQHPPRTRDTHRGGTSTLAAAATFSSVMGGGGGGGAQLRCPLDPRAPLRCAVARSLPRSLFPDDQSGTSPG